MKRYAFISVEKANYPLSMLCRVMRVSKSGYYAAVKRPTGARKTSDEVLCAELHSVHIAARGTYGSIRMCAALRRRNIHVGRNRVRRLMRQEGLQTTRKARFRPCTTDSKHSFPVAKNVVDRKFSLADNPVLDRTWVGDVTYIATVDGWYYLAVLLDLASRRVVAWTLSDKIDTELVTSTIDKACKKRRPRKGLTCHSDRGSNYASKDTRKSYNGHGIRASMSRRANCWDNAVSESFFKTLKAECPHFDGKAEPSFIATVLFDYIDAFYNTTRLHSTLGFMAPSEYEKGVLKT
jgi:putative transposase